MAFMFILGLVYQWLRTSAGAKDTLFDVILIFFSCRQRKNSQYIHVTKSSNSYRIIYYLVLSVTLFILRCDAHLIYLLLEWWLENVSNTHISNIVLFFFNFYGLVFSAFVFKKPIRVTKSGHFRFTLSFQWHTNKLINHDYGFIKLSHIKP